MKFESFLTASLPFSIHCSDYQPPARGFALVAVA
jgi:hypothetical protein